MYYSGQEIVEIAVRIEENGNEFYTAAAEMIEESTDIKGLFFDLAEKEILHISIFQKLAEKFDAESFKKLLNSKRDKGDEMRDFVLKELARFHAILTVEQRQDLAKIIENGPMPGIGQRRERGPEPEKRDPDRK